MTARFRFHRAGVLNVWQYDEQVFDFADGRLLLRGANGAGKSKTMEMLLPFVLDGDQTRLTASGRHHTSLVWLLLDGYDGSARTGYLWVELVRETPTGEVESLTCGVGLRATASARQASTWFFTTPRRIGVDLELDPGTGPMSQAALTALLVQDEGRSHVFDNGRRYREHIGQHLFGLPPEQYESLLRLIYWLRRPQVGEDIDPKRLAAQLVNALPFVDADTLAAAGTTFDELEAHGEEIDRQSQSALALARFLETYAAYARSVLATRGEAARAASREVRAARRDLRETERQLDASRVDLGATTAARDEAGGRAAEAGARIAALEASPEARSRASLDELRKRVTTLEAVEAAAAGDVDRAGRRALASGDTVAAAARGLDAAIDALRTMTSDAHTALTSAGVGPQPVPAALALLVAGDWTAAIDLDGAAAEVSSVATGHATWISDSRTRSGQRLAAVHLVTEALTARQEATARAEEAQRVADQAEGRADAARRSAGEAREGARAAAAAYADAFAAWCADEAAAGMVLPEVAELTEESLDALQGVIERAVSPVRQARAGEVAAARGRVAEASSAIATLRARRAEIEQQADPAPEPPAWHRDPRESLEGAPLWRVVDFRPGLDPGARAGVEAALEAAGLLDAWLTPDGALLGGLRHDVGLLATDPARGHGDSHRTGAATLAAYLVADPPAESRVVPAVVESVLASVAVLDGEDGARSGLAVGADGRWVVGPAHGRTAKEGAQFIGASARAQERRRRIEQLDREIEEQEQAQRRAERDLVAATEAARRVEDWVARRPGHSALLSAWARESTLAEASSRAESELAAALSAARRAREAEGARHAELAHLAEVHHLPTDSGGLQARREQLRAAETTLADAERGARDLSHAAREWHGHAVRARTDLDDAAATERRLDAARVEARAERARHDELVAAAGAGIAELEERLRTQRDARAEARAEAARLGERREVLLGDVASLDTMVQTRRETLAEREPRLEQAYDALTQLYAVPGLIGAAQVMDDATRPPSDPAQVRRMTELASAGSHASPNDLLQALTVVQSGPASVVEPRLLDIGGAMAAIGRGDGGDEALTELAHRLTVKVEADRALLTERERELFETHVLGQLGDALRAVRRQAEELVAAMNGQLQSVTTSQGIRVRLRWRLRDDIPADARRAIDLLGNPGGALLAEERADLRNALHRLIDISRSEAPEDSYAEHLARALDYREWFAFSVQYQRPEDGQWRDLQTRSALSQGEQKVLCYLPLFAAAAAHFTSLAGAAPHAPRFVLLDDAFPKIDARTHPLLFGLLVDLDLDFVVTSERLWGTHSTVPALAIYEALRNPSQRGIAQFEHRWDGHQLTAVGADG